MMSRNTHLKGILDFRGVPDIGFFYLFWRSDMMCRMYQDLPQYKCLTKNLQYLKLVVTLWIYVFISDAIISKILCFPVFCLDDFEFSFVLTIIACFLCAFYGNVTVVCSLSLKKPCKNIFENRRYVPIFFDVIMGNNLSHKSGANSTLYNVAMKCFPLSSHFFI